MKRRGAAAALVLFALASDLPGCAPVPNGNHIVSEAAAAPAAPKLIGAQGPLTEEQSRAVLAKIGSEGPGAGALERHIAIEQAVAENPLVEGNAVLILKDGDETLRAIFTAIEGAKDHVNLEYFIFDDVVSDGTHLGDLLVKKRAEGVAVNVIYDDFGSSDTKAAFLSRLKKAGVQLIQYHPLNPLKGKESYDPMERDHRKILVVDGTVAIIGGVNLSDTYESFSARKKPAAAPTDKEYWRDDDVELLGPIVGHIQQIFLDQWESHQGAPLNKAHFFPKLTPAGHEIARVIGSTAQKSIPRYYVALLSAIRTARERIWVTAAYFVPTPDLMEDLEHAAGRGVDVRLLLPDHSDSALALAAQHAHYEKLLKAGVKIYEIHGEVLHCKTVVIDGVWSVVGSSNLDRRSVIRNDEIDVVVLGRETGAALEAMYNEDLRNTRTITAEKWRRRPPLHRLQELYALLWESHL